MLIEQINKQNETFLLKKGSRKSNVRHESRKEERRNESGKHQKKGWREKVNDAEHSKNLDEWLDDEITRME